MKLWFEAIPEEKFRLYLKPKTFMLTNPFWVKGRF